MTRKDSMTVVFAKDGYVIKRLNLAAAYDSKFLWMDIVTYFIGGLIDINNHACYNWECSIVNGVLTKL